MAEASVQESVVKDAKSTATSSEAVTKEPVSFDESDLKELESAKAVPYDRFKEVNEEKKTLKAELAKLKESYQYELSTAKRQAELDAIARREEASVDTLEVEPWERQTKTISRELEMTRKELEQVKAEAASVRLNSDLDRLAKKYPEADQLSVLGWKKSQPHLDLEELMQRSHNREVEKVQAKLNALIEKKREKRAVSLPVRESAVRLKPEEKPKTLREAGKGLKKILADKGLLG